MSAEWQELAIGDVAEIVGGGTPSTKDEFNFNGDIPWITPKDLSGYTHRYIARGDRNISKKGLQNSSARLLPKDTVLLTTRAPVGYVAIATNPVSTNQGFRSLILRDGYEPEFFYYLLKSNTDYLRAHASGTTFGELTGSTLKGLSFRIPPLPEQRAIAHVLGTLDDKIELNRRMNQTLETMAQALFKSWFVNFEPFRDQGMHDSALGEIPVGWRVGKLEEIAYFVKGVSYRSDDLQDSDVALVTLKSVARGGGYQPQGLKPYTGEYESEQELRPGEVIVAHTDLTQKAEVLGRAARVQAHPAVRTLVASLDLVIVRPTQHKASNEFLYGLLSRDEFQEHAYGYANGTTVLHLSTKALPEYQCIIPPLNIISDYTRIISPLYQLFDSNEMQSSILVSIRDTLLPKLLSGEIRVRDAERFLERAL